MVILLRYPSHLMMPLEEKISVWFYLESPLQYPSLFLLGLFMCKLLEHNNCIPLKLQEVPAPKTLHLMAKKIIQFLFMLGAFSKKARTQRELLKAWIYIQVAQRTTSCPRFPLRCNPTKRNRRKALDFSAVLNAPLGYQASERTHPTETKVVASRVFASA